MRCGCPSDSVAGRPARPLLSARPAPAVEGALLVDVRLDGVRFAGQYVGMEELIQRVRIALADAPDRRVLVRPAERVKLQDAVRILDALSATGVKQLSLMETAPSGSRR